jgi:hypothetical protein
MISTEKARSFRTYLAVDTCGMVRKPESPNPISLECLQGHKETSLPGLRSLRISPRSLEDELGAILGRSK